MEFVSVGPLKQCIKKLMVNILNNLPKLYIIICKQVDKRNALSITRFTQEELFKFFFASSVLDEKLVFTCAAAYMIKNFKKLRIFYSHFLYVIHVTHRQQLDIVKLNYNSLVQTITELVHHKNTLKMWT